MNIKKTKSSSKDMLNVYKCQNEYLISTNIGE